MTNHIDLAFCFRKVLQVNPIPQLISHLGMAGAVDVLFLWELYLLKSKYNLTMKIYLKKHFTYIKKILFAKLVIKMGEVVYLCCYYYYYLYLLHGST